MLRATWLALLVACGATAPPPVPSSSAPPHAPRVVKSCALDEPRTIPLDLSFGGWIGTIGDRSWAYVAQGGMLGLARLRDGALAVTKLPIREQTPLLGAVSGTTLHLLVQQPGGDRIVLGVDLAGSAPHISEDDLLPASAVGDALAFATNGRWTLVWTRAAGGTLRVWDRKRHAVVATEPFVTDHGVAPQLHCAARCFAVGTEHDRVVALRFDGGAFARETVADPARRAWIAGDGSLVVWTEGTVGHVRRIEHGVPGETASLGELDDGTLMRRHLVFARKTEWYVAPLDGLRPGAATKLALFAGMDVRIAEAQDGMLVISSFEPANGEPTDMHAVFASDDGALQKANLRDNHKDQQPVPLVEPGYAAALVAASGSTESELVVLREPCP